MSPKERRRFDTVVEEVLEELPDEVLERIEEVPLVVEDHPTEAVADEGLAERDELCGLYTGVPMTERGNSDTGPIPDRITLYREALLDECRDARGRVDRGELKRQIRLTILHEMGHHFGLGEEDLKKLGYD